MVIYLDNNVYKISLSLSQVLKIFLKTIFVYMYAAQMSHF